MYVGGLLHLRPCYNSNVFGQELRLGAAALLAALCRPNRIVSYAYGDSLTCGLATTPMPLLIAFFLDAIALLIFSPVA